MKIVRKSMLFTALLALTLLLCFPIWFAVTGAFSAQWELEVKSGQLYLFSPAEPAQGRKPLTAGYCPGCGLPIGGPPWLTDFAGS